DLDGDCVLPLELWQQRVEHAVQRVARENSHSTLTFAAAATFLHCGISRWMTFRKSSGVPPTGATPSASSLSIMSFCLMILFTSAFTRSTIGRGRPFGPMRPCQLLTSYPLTPDSSIVGVFGSAGMRLAVVTAIGLNFPPL